MALVVKRFFVSNVPREDGAYVDILARESGLLAWLFALLKLDPNYSLTVLFDKIHYESSSIRGFTRVILPIQSVSSIYFGTARPWAKALAWFLLFVSLAYAAAQFGQTLAVALLVLVGVLASILVFIFNRELLIGVTEHTGADYELKVKRSAIEGQEISEERLAEIARIFMALVDAHKSAVSQIPR